MPLTSKITPYNESWPLLFQEAVQQLRPALGDTCLALHHVGSTAAEGLSAKPEIDMLAVVSTSEPLTEWETAWRQLGYRRGGDLSEGHHFFKRDVDGVRTHKLHVCLSGHQMITRMLELRDHLRKNQDDRCAYEALKLRLEESNRSGIAAYLKGKKPFLDDLYEKIQGKR